MQRHRWACGPAGRAAALALAAVASASASSAAPTVRAHGILTPGAPGETLHEIAWRRTTTTTRDDGPPQRAELRQRLVLRLKAEDPENAGRSEGTGEPVVFLGSVDRVALGLQMGDESVSIERPKITLEEEPDGASAKALVAMAEAVRGAEIRLVVVPSEGVARVSGLDAVIEATADQPMAPVLIGLLAPAEFGRAISPAFGGCGGAKAQDPAAGWTTEESGDLGPAGALRIRTAWSLDSATGPMLRFVGSSAASVERAEAPAPGAPVITLNEQESPSVLEWDGERDVLVRFEQKRAMRAAASLGPARVSVDIDSELSVTRAKEP